MAATPLMDFAQASTFERYQTVSRLARILQELSRTFRPKGRLAFVGGTALRFAHALPRFSEDLDFSLERQEGYEPRSAEEWARKPEVRRDSECSSSFGVYITIQFCILTHMKHGELVALVKDCGWFDLATLTQATTGSRQALQIQLSRWCKSGKLLPLRRGMYALPEIYRSKPLNPTELASGMYAPSYLSRHWALGYYGMIPERVVEFTSITSRAPKCFKNAFGTFSYRHVKPAAFFGYKAVDLNGSRVFLADPEKALLDLWYLESGEWTEARMEAMRFQAFEIVSPETLRGYAERFGSPRLLAATQTWLGLSRQAREEGVEL